MYKALSFIQWVALLFWILYEVGTGNEWPRWADALFVGFMALILIWQMLYDDAFYFKIEIGKDKSKDEDKQNPYL